MDIRIIIKLYKKVNKIVELDQGFRYRNFCRIKLIWSIKKSCQLICKFFNSFSSRLDKAKKISVEL